MSGSFNQNRRISPFASGWKTHEKTGGGASLYAKYDTQTVVIVSRVNTNGKTKKREPVQIQFSKAAYEAIGKPKRVVVRSNGELVGFFPVDEDRPPHDVDSAYSAILSEGEAQRPRPSFNMKTVIAEHRLRSGVYNAQIFREGEELALVIIATDAPSQP